MGWGAAAPCKQGAGLFGGGVLPAGASVQSLLAWRSTHEQPAALQAGGGQGVPVGPRQRATNAAHRAGAAALCTPGPLRSSGGPPHCAACIRAACAHLRPCKCNGRRRRRVSLRGDGLGCLGCACRGSSTRGWWSTDTSPPLTTPAASPRCLPTTSERRSKQQFVSVLQVGNPPACANGGWRPPLAQGTPPRLQRRRGLERASSRRRYPCRRRCLQQHGAQHTWMGFIDVDEFLMFRCVGLSFSVWLWPAACPPTDPCRCAPGCTCSALQRTARRAPPAPRGRHCRDPWPAIQSLPALLREFEGPALPPNATSGAHTRPARCMPRAGTRACP